MRRRSLLSSPALALQLAATAAPASSEARTLFAYGDGIPYDPAQYSTLLAKLTASGQARADDYSRGGVVEQLESRMAAMLGKETAVWMPTGTLANHLAVRLLAGSKRRVAVQAESHLYNDCGDCAQSLSNLNLLPLAPGKASFSLDELDRAATDSVMGRVPAPVGAIQIETPVRRRSGERFDFAQMQRISAWARRREIGLHLDGARLFLESAYSSKPASEYAALFDTVYVSMYKCFNAASGAILAGPRKLLADLVHTRRMFGGSLHQSWPSALVALHHLEGFESRYKAAVRVSEEALAVLSRDPSFELERIPNGTNVFRLKVPDVNAPVYQGRLEAAGVSARPPATAWLTMQVNETWGQFEAAEIVARFRKALS